VAGPVGVASLINDAPTYFGGEPVSATLTGLGLRAAGQDFGGELNRQRAALATIDGLIPRVAPEQARQLRALRYAPQMNEDEIAAILGTMSSNRRLLPLGF
jgi:hypothetical protein